MDKILVSCCYTCKNYDGTKCNRLNIEPDEDFVCDYFRRKNSGAFRRKWRKAKKEWLNEKYTLQE